MIHHTVGEPGSCCGTDDVQCARHGQVRRFQREGSAWFVIHSMVGERGGVQVLLHYEKLASLEEGQLRN